MQFAPPPGWGSIKGFLSDGEADALDVVDAYDEEIEVVTERATALLEPIMIVLLAIVVGFIVWAIVLPILQVGSIG